MAPKKKGGKKKKQKVVPLELVHPEPSTGDEIETAMLWDRVAPLLPNPMAPPGGAIYNFSTGSAMNSGAPAGNIVGYHSAVVPLLVNNPAMVVHAGGAHPITGGPNVSSPFGGMGVGSSGASLATPGTTTKSQAGTTTKSDAPSSAQKQSAGGVEDGAAMRLQPSATLVALPSGTGDGSTSRSFGAFGTGDGGASFQPKPPPRKHAPTGARAVQRLHSAEKKRNETTKELQEKMQEHSDLEGYVSWENDQFKKAVETFRGEIEALEELKVEQDTAHESQLQLVAREFGIQKISLTEKLESLQQQWEEHN